MNSDYLIFIDESGDHGLASIDRHYPVFVLCCVLIRKDHYVNQLVPRLTKLKLDVWGHAEVVLHEHDIRKPKGVYSILQIEHVRNAFHQQITEIFAECEYMLIYSVIKKEEYARRYAAPASPYDLSMSFVLERAFLELNSRGQGARKTHVVVECRGKVEDAQLATAFERIVNGNNACGRALPFDLVMVPKVANSAGLQLADLAARPIGIRTIRPEQANRAYETIRTKIRRNAQDEALGWGVKLFP
ncbi:DUF3800 domain-containing protein [Lysobacter niastensis]|uniref:DUF3800 domain-containing protein n=1 Tax=Lysobacter niastensis TaxID=380629 RepID=A0ABS0B306_9GAMM|nr:DUF3800 domain-containing protein [Lysobacter niastensis]MBF6022870.1 DUF3800 domain-containing protein [Lysobacter niastensis]